VRASASRVLARPETTTAEVLERSIDFSLLRDRGWDLERRVFEPRADDPLFGYHLCERVNCGRGGTRAAAKKLGLCDDCYKNFAQRSSAVSIEAFKARPLRHGLADEDLCRVCRTPGHERPAHAHGLCLMCLAQLRARDQSPDAYVDGDDRWPPARPRPSLGRCEVDGCCRLAARKSTRLCRACERRWNGAGRPALSEFALAGRYRPMCTGRAAAMPAVAALVELQLLAGLQAHIERGLSFPVRSIERSWELVGRAEVDDLCHLPTLPAWPEGRRLLQYALRFEHRAGSTPELEVARDRWRLWVFDGRSSDAALDFTLISQPWLRASAKRYMHHMLATRASSSARAALVRIVKLSRFLRTTAEEGSNPAVLTRGDMERLLIWLRANTASPNDFRRHLGETARFLDYLRASGLYRRGEAAAGLSDSFCAWPGDIPREIRRDPEEPGRALPDAVLAQLMQPGALAALEQIYVPYRCAVELLAHTGRRPIEVLSLACDCLVEEQGASGSGPVLRYLREKPPRGHRNLPIHVQTADIIRTQRRWVQDRYRGRALADLALLPRKTRNPDGASPVDGSTFATALRVWMRGLDVRGDDGTDFPADEITPYSFRHTYAQRHADAGVQLDVLQKLMDHLSPETTQGYYRVTLARRREAVEMVAPLTIDRHLTVSRADGTLPDAEELRRGIGRIPVPLGYCTEPHNVKALGGSCPFSHKCLGCDWFRTDPSYLADLYTYLDELLAAKERLRATVPVLADWARERAVPADQEIRAVRELIRRSEELLDELDPSERGRLEELLRVLRAARATTTEALPVHQIAGTRPPRPTFAPPSPSPPSPSTTTDA
jgi:integrase